MKCVLGTGINFRNSFIHGYPKHEGLGSLDGWDWRDRIWHTVLDDFKVAQSHQRHDIKDANGGSE